MASTGVVFPVSGEDQRSTSALGRAVMADAVCELVIAQRAVGLELR